MHFLGVEKFLGNYGIGIKTSTQKVSSSEGLLASTGHKCTLDGWRKLTAVTDELNWHPKNPAR